MHAVVINVTVNDREAATAALQNQVVPQVSQAPGFVAGYWVGLEGGRGTSIVAFESEDAARAASERGARPRFVWIITPVALITGRSDGFRAA